MKIKISELLNEKDNTFKNVTSPNATSNMYRVKVDDLLSKKEIKFTRPVGAKEAEDAYRNYIINRSFPTPAKPNNIQTTKIDPLDEDTLRANMANNRTEPTLLSKVYNKAIIPIGQSVHNQYEKLDDYNFGEKALNEAYRIAQENKQNVWDEDLLRTQRLINNRNELLGYMTPEQKLQYGRTPENKKKDYLDTIMADLQQKKGINRAEEIRNIEDSTNQALQKIALSGESGANSFKSGLKGSYNLLRGANETVAKDASEYAFNELRPETKGALGVAMDLTNTVGNMAPSIALGVAGAPIGLGALGTISMGASSAGKGYDTAIGEGYSADQAAAYGVASGLSEALLQKIAGAIPGVSNAQGLVTRFLGKYGDNVLAKVVSNPSLRKAVVNVLGNAASEGAEEGTQEILDTLLRNYILGENNEIDWKNVGYSAALGAMTGSAFAVPGGVNTLVNRDSSMKTEQNAPINNNDTIKTRSDINMSDELLNDMNNVMAKAEADRTLSTPLLRRPTDFYGGKEGLTTKRPEPTPDAGDLVAARNLYLGRSTTPLVNKNFYSPVNSKQVLSKSSADNRKIDTIPIAVQDAVETDSPVAEKSTRVEDITEDSTFKRGIEKFKSGEYTSADDIVILEETPLWLYNKGVEQNIPITLNMSKLKDVMKEPKGKFGGTNQHGITMDIVEQLPEAIKNPLNVIKSKGFNDRFVVVTRLTDQYGDIVIVPIEVNSKGKVEGITLDVNKINSIYGKEDYDASSKGKPSGYMEYNKDNIVYDIDKSGLLIENESGDSNGISSYRFQPKETPLFNSNNSIHKSGENINTSAETSGKYLEAMGMDDGSRNISIDPEEKGMFKKAGIIDEANEINRQYGRSYDSNEESSLKTNKTPLKLFTDEDVELSDSRVIISNEGAKLFTEVSNTINELRKKRDEIQRKNPLTEADKNRAKAILAMGGDIYSVSGIDNLGGVREWVAINKELSDYEKLKKTMTKEQREVNNDIAIEAMQATGGFKDLGNTKNLKFSLETPERIFEDISGTKEGAEYLKDTYTRPMKQNEAKKTNFFNKIAKIIKALDIDDKKKYSLEVNPFLPSGKRSDIIEKVTVTEQGLVQLYGEGIINEAQLKEVGADVEHIKKAAETIRDIYDDVLILVNKARISAGYEPIQKRNNYFPHFTELAPKTPFEKVMHAMSMDVTQSELPVEIAGLTESFKPGKKYETYSNKREGIRSEYNAAKGLEMYLNTAADVIFHTQDIQKLRGLERMLRFEYSSDEIKNKVQEIWKDTNKDEDAKFAEVNAIYEAATTSLPGFVNYLTRYTNALAGKKSYGIDRDLEFMFGRQVYTTAVKVADRVAANMVAGNISSAMTNFIPIPKVIAISDGKSLADAIAQAVSNVFRRDGGDGLMERSNFYTSRMGKDKIYYGKAWGDKFPADKISKVLGIPFDVIDSFSTETVVRAIYNNRIKKGFTPDAAMKQADEWAAKLMADRSYGARPMIFETKALKPLTMFGIESLNDLEFVFRDLPKEEKEKGAAYIGAQLFKVFLGTFLYNELYESFFGRRPTLDPIDMAAEAIATGFGYTRNNLVKETIEGAKNGGLKFAGYGNGFEAFTPRAGGGSIPDAITNLGGDVIENIPIVGSVMGGGRLPITNVIPEIKIGEDVPTTVKNIGKELLGTTGLYAFSPVGAGSQIGKTYRGWDAYFDGGMKSGSGDNEKLKFPIERDAYNFLAATVGGPYATREGKEYIERGFPQLSAERTKNYYKVVEAGITYPQYIAAMQAIKGIESDKDENGNSIDYSKARKQKAAIDKVAGQYGLNETQRRVLYEANNVSDKVW